MKSSIEMAREARVRRISQIEEALARPSEEGPEWDKRRAQLERELERLRAVQAHVARKATS